MIAVAETLCDLCEIIDIQNSVIKELCCELEQLGATIAAEERIQLAEEKYAAIAEVDTGI